MLIKIKNKKKEERKPQPQSLTQDSQNLHFLCHKSVQSQGSLQAGAEHQIAIWREGQPGDRSAVLPERGQKTWKKGKRKRNLRQREQ